MNLLCFCKFDQKTISYLEFMDFWAIERWFNLSIKNIYFYIFLISIYIFFVFWNKTLFSWVNSFFTIIFFSLLLKVYSETIFSATAEFRELLSGIDMGSKGCSLFVLFSLFLLGRYRGLYPNPSGDDLNRLALFSLNPRNNLPNVHFLLVFNAFL